MDEEIYEVQEQHWYRSRRSNHLCRVIFVGRHAQDCSESMVCYRTVNATQDAPPGQVWMCPESMFVKVWKETDEQFDEADLIECAKCRWDYWLDRAIKNQQG